MRGLALFASRIAGFDRVSVDKRIVGRSLETGMADLALISVDNRAGSAHMKSNMAGPSDAQAQGSVFFFVASAV
jgi:hypothetical protein